MKTSRIIVYLWSIIFAIIILVAIVGVFLGKTDNMAKEVCFMHVLICMVGLSLSSLAGLILEDLDELKNNQRGNNEAK